MTFATEFPNFPAADYPALPEGFTDSSWVNDSCPSMKNESLCLIVYVDFVEQSRREFPDAPRERFCIDALDSDGYVTDGPILLSTDDWSAVLALIDSRRK